MRRKVVDHLEVHQLIANSQRALGDRDFCKDHRCSKRPGDSKPLHQLENSTSRAARESQCRYARSQALLAESHALHIARDKGNSQRSSTVICPLLRSTTRDHLSQRTNFELTNGRLTDKRRPFTRRADEDYLSAQRDSMAVSLLRL